jgi:arsenical-resistance protein 2
MEHRMQNETPWYNNFPQPKSKPRSLSNVQVASLLNDPKKTPGKDYVIVDVRRTDFEVASSI